MNINNYVEVVLTKTGIDILENHYMKTYSHLPINIRMPLDMHLKASKQEPIQFQLWELMKMFGPHIFLGMNESPFVGNEIHIVKKVMFAGGLNHGKLQEIWEWNKKQKDKLHKLEESGVNVSVDTSIYASIDCLFEQLAERDRTISLLTEQITNEVAISAKAIANLRDARALVIVGRYDDALVRMDKALSRE